MTAKRIHSAPNFKDSGGHAMTRAFVLGSCAALVLGVAAANAGPCTTEIESLSKTLASRDAGQGPTPGAAATTGTNAPAGQHPPTATMSQQTQGVATSPQDVRQQNAGQPPAAQQGATTGAAGTGGEHPPTAAMDTQVQGQTPPSTGGHPPTAAMSQAMPPQAAPHGSVANTVDASAALERARTLDRQGKEADCMSAVAEARRLFGK
jgi:hypothetical protein